MEDLLALRHKVYLEAKFCATTGARAFVCQVCAASQNHVLNNCILHRFKSGQEPNIQSSFQRILYGVAGIAAAAKKGGRTVHNLLSFKFVEKWPLDTSVSSAAATMDRIQQANILIIDEMSMLTTSMLARVNARLQAVRPGGGNLPFGGMSVILVRRET